MNRTFLEFVGLDLPRYLAKGWFSFLHPSEAAAAQRTLEEAIGERKPYSLEHRVAKLQKEHSPEALPVHLATAIEDELQDLKPQLGRGHLQVEVDAATTIRFSEKNLRSVVYNLISNALKYCAPEREPHIIVRCEAQQEHHVLTVADNGLGLDASQQRQLFVMFKRLHNHVEGSGVGLYMVKKIMENSGGRIEVESVPGVGSTFRVYFVR